MPSDEALSDLSMELMQWREVARVIVEAPDEERGAALDALIAEADERGWLVSRWLRTFFGMIGVLLTMPSEVQEVVLETLLGPELRSGDQEGLGGL